MRHFAHHPSTACVAKLMRGLHSSYPPMYPAHIFPRPCHLSGGVRIVRKGGPATAPVKGDKRSVPTDTPMGRVLLRVHAVSPNLTYTSFSIPHMKRPPPGLALAVRTAYPLVLISPHPSSHDARVPTTSGPYVGTFGSEDPEGHKHSNRRVGRAWGVRAPAQPVQVQGFVTKDISKLVR